MKDCKITKLKSGKLKFVIYGNDLIDLQNKIVGYYICSKSDLLYLNNKIEDNKNGNKKN